MLIRQQLVLKPMLTVIVVMNIARTVHIMENGLNLRRGRRNNFEVILVTNTKRTKKEKLFIRKVNILIRDKCQCYLCGKRLNIKTMTLDHVIPITAGGPSTKDNLKACCYECNQARSFCENFIVNYDLIIYNNNDNFPDIFGFDLVLGAYSYFYSIVKEKKK